MDSIRDKLALERTRLANERTFLAYVRTALSLIAGAAVLFEFFSSSPSYLAVAWFLAVLGVIVFLSVSTALAQFAMNCVASHTLPIRTDSSAECASRHFWRDSGLLNSREVIVHGPYLILVQSAYTLTPPHTLLLAYGAGTYNRG